ncbi:hypothetical protein D3C85_522680 [compost metagenome]
MLVVVHDAHGHVQRGDEGRDGAIALTRHDAAFAVVFEFGFDAEVLAFAGRRIAVDAVADQLPGRLLFEVFAVEDRVHVVGRDFAAGFVRDALDGAAELDLQAARQHQAVFLFKQVRHAALARLAVHADHGVVAAAEVGGVDREVRHFPDGVGLLQGEALLDRVLVRTGERREDQVARIRVARVDGQLVAVFRAAAHFVDVGEIQARMHALRVEIQGQRDEVDVAGAFAAAEQAAFDAVGAGHHGELGGGNGGAAVVMRVHAEHDAVAARQVLVHPFDLVGVQIGAGGLDRGGQVQNHLVVGRGLPHVGHGIRDFKREFGFGRAEHFGRVLVAPFGLGALRRVLLDQARAGGGDALDLFLGHVEHDLAEGRRASVVHVDDRLLGARGGFHRAADQIFARLRQHDDGHVVGNALFVDELAHEVEIGLRGRRKAHFDFLEADLHELFKEADLAFHAHGLDQRLVAVAQVRAHPDGRLRDAAAGPGAFGEVAGKGREGDVFGGGVGKHHYYTSIGFL